jgi:hypothetical protein
VLSAEVFENNGNIVDANGIGPHCLRPVVWDGSPAADDDDEIAQAIWDHEDRGHCIPGACSRVSRRMRELGPITVFFDRASTSHPSRSSSTSRSLTGVSRDDVKAAIQSPMTNAVGGRDLSPARRLRLQRRRRRRLHLLHGQRRGRDLPAVQNLIYLLDAGDITVTGDVT